MTRHRWKVIGACLLCALPPVLLLFFLAQMGIGDLVLVTTNQKSALEDQSKRLKELEAKQEEVTQISDIQQAAVDLAKKLDQFVSASVDAVSTVAKMPSVFGMNAAAQRGELEKQSAAHPDFEAWYGYDVQWRGFTSFPDSPAFVGQDQSSNQDAKQALTSFRPVVSDLRAKRFTIYIPIVSIEGKPKGVVAAEVKSSSAMAQFNDSLALGYVLFLVKRGENKAPALLLSLPETSTAATPEKLAPVIEKIGSGDSGGGMRRKEDDGSTSLVGFAPLQEATWTVGVIQSEMEYRTRHKPPAGKEYGRMAAASSFAAPFAIGGPWFWALLLAIVLSTALAFLAALTWLKREPAPEAEEVAEESDESTGTTTTVRRVVEERRVEHVEETHEEES